MFVEVATLSEGLVAHFTYMWFLARVEEHVSSEGATLIEGIVAHFALMRLDD